MKFSASIEYAIHGLVYLTRAAAGKTTLVSEVATAINVPESYLRKVFQQLTRSGILNSQRGARGGFILAQSADSVTLKDIVEAIDGSLPVYKCMQRQRECTLDVDCPVQREFGRAQQMMAGVLEQTSINDLAGELSENQKGVSWLKVNTDRWLEFAESQT